MPPKRFSSKTLFLTGTWLFALNLWNYEPTPRNAKQERRKSLSILKIVTSTSSGFAHRGHRPPRHLLTPPQIASGFQEQADFAPRWGSACRRPWQPLPEAGPYPRANGRSARSACDLTPNGRQRALRTAQPPRLPLSRARSPSLNPWRLLSPASPQIRRLRTAAPCLGQPLTWFPVRLRVLRREPPDSGYSSRAPTQAVALPVSYVRVRLSSLGRSLFIQERRERWLDSAGGVWRLLVKRGKGRASCLRFIGQSKSRHRSGLTQAGVCKRTAPSRGRGCDLLVCHHI